MTVSLFPGLVCLPLFEQNSGLFNLSIEHNRITQDVIGAQMTGAVSFLISETKGSESRLLLLAFCMVVRKLLSSKFPKN